MRPATKETENTTDTLALIHNYTHSEIDNVYFVSVFFVV